MTVHVRKRTFDALETDRSHGHVFRGEATAAPLIAWLNGGKAERIESLLAAAARRRNLLEPVTAEMVDRMVATLQAASAKKKSLKPITPRMVQVMRSALRVEATIREPKMTSPDRYRPGQSAAFQLTTLEINRILREYRLSPVLFASEQDHWAVSWFGGKIPRDEAAALFRLLELASAGLLAHVRRCDRPGCVKWFYARFEHQRFDEEACRLKVLASDPRRKEARRHYMKNLRRIHKVRKQVRERGRTK